MDKQQSAKPQSRRPASLTGAQRRHLRALAHSLKPVVQIGHKGLTAEVIAQIDAALETHELIKLKVGKDAPVEMKASVDEIEKLARAHVAQTIGKTFVIYRQRKEKPTIVLPKPAKKARALMPGGKFTPSESTRAPKPSAAAPAPTPPAKPADPDDWSDVDAKEQPEGIVEIG